jgi:hypothetical protein
MVFELDLATVRLLVRPIRAKSDQSDNNEGEQTARNASVQAWSVTGLILESAQYQHIGLASPRPCSTYLKINPPAIPPTPPIPTSVAEQNARFHCPRMLLAWYDITAGTLLFAPAVVKKTPEVD